jgi:putative component of toxin-antitoxin plasmid stabilization module
LECNIQIRIDARFTRISLGNFGDYKSIEDGVFELRFHFGTGYRIYYGLDETLKDGDIEPFLLALKNIIKARKINQINNSVEVNLDSLITQEINLNNLYSILNQVGLTIDFKPVELEN